ncbi:MAG: DUF2946 family protein [Pseudomonadota bacterium]
MQSHPDIARPRGRARGARPAILAWLALAALVFATGLAPLLHESLHEHLAGHEHGHAHCHGPAAGLRAPVDSSHEHHACTICLTLAGLHLAKPGPALTPAPEAVASPRPELARPLRLGLLHPLGFRHRGPPAFA